MRVVLCSGAPCIITYMPRPCWEPSWPILLDSGTGSAQKSGVKGKMPAMPQWGQQPPPLQLLLPLQALCVPRRAQGKGRNCACMCSL